MSATETDLPLPSATAQIPLEDIASDQDSAAAGLR